MTPLFPTSPPSPPPLSLPPVAVAAARWLVAVAVAAVVAAAVPPPAAQAEEQLGKPAVLMELFTSQGCYSCPPADELLKSTYVPREDVVPLEFHVDYWDTLVYGFAGSWKDPFSSPNYTNRQQNYARKLFRSGMFTPHFVIQGRHETPGVRQAVIAEAVKEETLREQPLQFYFSGSADEGFSARVEGTLHGSEKFFYAIYIRQSTTQVTAGENKGKSMTNSHIVRDFKHQPAIKRRFTIPAHDGQQQGCAVWVQKGESGAVIAAARCPNS